MLEPRKAWLLAAAAVCAAVASGCHHETVAVRGDNAAGDSTCLSCHVDHASFEQTAHHLTSRLPTRASIAGSFTPGLNVLRTSNPSLYFRMDSTADGFYETAVSTHVRDTTTRTERIAIVTGIRKGQSYLYWAGHDQLYQLPVSYWTGSGWAYSPGYADGRPNFDRLIPPRCLECHATWVEAVPAPGVVNRYQRADAILGISCETCHGAGRDHVRNERSSLHWLLPRSIVNPANLPRARQLDGCALCHNGTAPLRTDAFAYVPGQVLQKRTALATRIGSDTVDVHGNQVALLERSRCYRSSQMTCTTCHDVHREQRDVLAFSGTCLTCHTPQSCGLYPKYGQRLVGRCVDCHMPALTSATVIANSPGHQLRVQVRSHWIKVYAQMDTLPSGSY